MASDTRTGLPGGPDEAAGGDAAAALLVAGDSPATPVLAEIVAWESATEEFLDRWRASGDGTSKLWEERFGENRYADLAAEALKIALASAGIDSDDVSRLVVAGGTERAASAVSRKSGIAADRHADRLKDTVGNPGAAQPALLLASILETAESGQNTCCSPWPTVPTPSFSAPPRRSRTTVRPGRSRPR